MRWSALAGAAVLVVVALALGGTVAWLRLQEPLAALPHDPPSAVAEVEVWREPWQGRTLLHVLLRGAAVRDVRFVVSLPDPMPAARIPIVVVLGGLRGGSGSIREISEVAASSIRLKIATAPEPCSQAAMARTRAVSRTRSPAPHITMPATC